MKSVIYTGVAVLLLLPAVVGAQIPGGLIMGRPAKPKSAGQLATEKAQQQHRVDLEKAKAANNPENFRVVDGQLYNVALSEKWVTLPGKYKRGKFARMTPAGPAFTIETEMSTATAVWYAYDREIVLRNYPFVTKEAGQWLVDIRALPVRTGEDGSSVYDCGTLPQPKPVAASTNAPARSGAANVTTNEVAAVKP